MKNKKRELILFLLMFPVLSMANDLDFKGLINSIIGRFGETMMIIIFSVAFIGFFLGTMSLINSKEASSREAAKKKVIWGIVALVIMFSVWGIVGLVKNSFDLNDDHIDTYPSFYLDN